jgi:curved DNA-binding protein CbpA
MVEQAFTGFVALEAPNNPQEILGVGLGAREEEIDAAYRRKAVTAHPDKGGSARAMAELSEARKKVKEQAA